MKNRFSFRNIVQIYLPSQIATALFVAISTVACAQNTLTLQQAINNAFANRKNIKSGKTDVMIRRLQTESLYRKYWPQVSVAYSYQYNPILQTSILPIGIFNSQYPADATKSVQFGTKWSQTAGVTVNQPIMDLSINRQINEAKLQQRLAAASEAQTEYELAYAVAQVYIDINLQEARIRSAAADTGRTWNSYQLLQSRYEQKRLLKSELNKGSINHNNAVQQYSNAVSQLIEEKVYLLYLTGSNNIDNPDFAVDSTFVNNKIMESANAQPLVANIPELQQLQLKGEMATKQIKTEKARYLPTVSMKGYLGANQYTARFDPMVPNSWYGLSYLGVDLKYPILFGEHKQKKIQQLQLQSTQYEEQKEERTTEYYKDAITARIKMERMQSELKTIEENIALSRESIGIYQARVAEGQESANTLNREEADLQKLDADHQTGKKQYWSYLLDFLKATGQIEMLWK
jgi:outer membrane protein TolC